MRNIITFSDGGARGNPGPAAFGAVIYEIKSDGSRERIASLKKYLGETTNNQAEYQGLVAALEKAKELKPDAIICYLDSELIVKQLNLKYKVKNKELEPHFIKAWNMLKTFNEYKVVHIPREENKEADALVNEALDENV